MKNLSAKSIFGTTLSIFLLASCVKKDPDFKSAFKNLKPEDLTMTYTWKTNNQSSTNPAKTSPVTNVPVHQEISKPIKNSPVPILTPDTRLKIK